MDGAGDGQRFFALIGKFGGARRIACRLFCPELFFLAELVVLHDVPGRVQNGLGGTVVLLQFHHFGFGIFLFKFEDVADVRPSPDVNALIIIAHHAQVAVFGGQGLDEDILGAVRVLVFVHQDVAETLLELFADVRFIA